jgi:predicted DNA-binding protein (MmcQ/YjbR family)
MNKTYWNTVAVGGDVPEEDIKRMVGNSYDLIKPKVRKRK